MINLHERKLPTWQESNPKPPDVQSDVHPTEPLRPASAMVETSSDNDKNINVQCDTIIKYNQLYNYPLIYFHFHISNRRNKFIG